MYTVHFYKVKLNLSHGSSNCLAFHNYLFQHKVQPYIFGIFICCHIFFGIFICCHIFPWISTPQAITYQPQRGNPKKLGLGEKLEGWTSTVHRKKWRPSIDSWRFLYFFSQESENIAKISFREAPFSLSPPPFGHCPNSIYPPPPALKRALWGTFFRPDLSDFVKSPF